VSKALLKSIEMTNTYGLSSSILVTVSRMDIIAAVAEPEGRKANWFENAKFAKNAKQYHYAGVYCIYTYSDDVFTAKVLFIVTDVYTKR